jgi:16S rRNA U516 pseudouridylate synthase RsuA-like enzyme
VTVSREATWRRGGASAEEPRRVLRGGEKILPSALRIDGTPLPFGGRRLHLALHKPVGAATSTDEREAPLVGDAFPADFGLRAAPPLAVGRLDRGASGLLLFTDDGALAARLAAPTRAVPKA